MERTDIFDHSTIANTLRNDSDFEYFSMDSGYFLFYLILFSSTTSSFFLWKFLNKKNHLAFPMSRDNDVRRVWICFVFLISK